VLIRSIVLQVEWDPEELEAIDAVVFLQKALSEEFVALPVLDEALAAHEHDAVAPRRELLDGNQDGPGQEPRDVADGGNLEVSAGHGARSGDWQLPPVARTVNGGAVSRRGRVEAGDAPSVGRGVAAGYRIQDKNRAAALAGGP